MRAPLLALVSILTLAACAPALNWRSVALGTSQPLLPCKPDRAQRDVQLAGHTLVLEMVGCEADGALFAASRIALPAGADAQAIRADWVRASLRNLGRPLVTDPPPDVRQLALAATGRSPDGQALEARFLWQQGSQELWLLAVYAPKVGSEMTEPFLVDLKLP